MGWSRKTVDAPMFAASIGVDRAVEANIGRVIVGYDRTRMVDAEGSIQPRGVLLRRLPSVVYGNMVRRLEAPRPVADCAAPGC